MNINIENKTNSKIIKKNCVEKVHFFATEKGCSINSFGITFVLDEEMAILNMQYLTHEGTTDVITFNYNEGEEDIIMDKVERLSNDDELFLSDDINGEIIICTEQAKRQAKDYGVVFDNEISRLIFHGLLHIIGLDDQTEEEKIVMKQNENDLLNKWYDA